MGCSSADLIDALTKFKHSGNLAPLNKYFGASGIQYPPIPTDWWYVSTFHLVPASFNTCVILISCKLN